MSEVETIVRNCTKKPLVLKEGSAGVYRTLTTLKVNSEYLIICNTSATYREYWVGVRPDSTQSTQPNSTQHQANSQALDIVTITSDDCASYERLHITSDPADSARLKVEPQRSRQPSSRMLTNCTNRPVTLETRENSNSREDVLQPMQKVSIQVGTKRGPEHTVSVGGKPGLPIDNRKAAKAQAVRIYALQQDPSGLQLKMVLNEWLQTEVTNKTDAEVTLRVRGDDYRLQPNEKDTIVHDPKSTDSTYSVVRQGDEKHISLEDISKYECIDVVSGASATDFMLKNQVPRSANVGWWSKMKGCITW